MKKAKSQTSLFLCFHDFDTFFLSEKDLTVSKLFSN